MSKIRGQSYIVQGSGETSRSLNTFNKVDGLDQFQLNIKNYKFITEMKDLTGRVKSMADLAQTLSGESSQHLSSSGSAMQTVETHRERERYEGGRLMLMYTGCVDYHMLYIASYVCSPQVLQPTFYFMGFSYYGPFLPQWPF